jgi:uncharacterized cupin superfamily protein
MLAGYAGQRREVTIAPMSGNAFDLSKTFVHLGLSASAIPLPDFSWKGDSMLAYLREFAAERDEQRLVGILPVRKTWDHWECHVGGDELVVLLSGRCDIIQENGETTRTIPLEPGQAVINRRGIWHTSDVHEPGDTLFIAGGRLTRYRPRDLGE